MRYRVSSLLMSCCLVGAALVASADAAAAQDGSGDTDDVQETSTSTSASSTTTSAVVETTTTTTSVDDSATQPTDPSSTVGKDESTTSSSEPSSTSEQPETTTTVVDDSAETSTTDPVDGTDSTVDPLINEGPTDEVLDPNVTVPPPSGAGVNVDFAPVPILMSSVREAEEKWADAVALRAEAIAEVRSLRVRAKELDVQQETLEERTQLTIDDLVAANKRLQDRAVRAFVHSSVGNPRSVLLSEGDSGGSGLTTEMFRSREMLVHQRKTRMIDTVVDVDQAGLGELADLREALGSSASELVQRWIIVDSSLRKAETTAREIETDIDQARIELEAFKAGSDIYVDGVVFPIAGQYSVPLINSYGYPRMPGTADAHAHQGIDIFAARGTPLVAAERGVIGRIGNGRLGGLKFWLRGESGADWYYAHLDGFAPGLHNGQVVEAGELLGYVGNTGNAITTPPHLHLEIHPGGGAAVNPYPLMKVVSDLDLKSFVDGVHPGFRYQPVVQQQPDNEATTDSSVPESSTTTVQDSTTQTTATSSSLDSDSTTTSSSTSSSTETTSAEPSSTTVTTASSDDASSGDSAETTVPTTVDNAADAPDDGAGNDSGGG